MRYENALLIDAPAALVWDLTTEVARWPEFTPTMQRIEPLDPVPLQVGGRARVKQPQQPPAVWTVTELELCRRFVWKTERPGLTMVGAHVLEDAGDRCRNTVSIELSGRAARVFGLLFGSAVRSTIDRENRAFKAEAERLAAGGA